MAYGMMNNAPTNGMPEKMTAKIKTIHLTTRTTKFTKKRPERLSYRLNTPSTAKLNMSAIAKNPKTGMPLNRTPATVAITMRRSSILIKSERE